MDNFFEILIYLFIIFSIFSPLFKKKEKKPPQEQQQRPEREEISTPAVTMEKDQDEYDILNEIEKMFKTDTVAAPPVIMEKQTAIEQKEGKKQTPIERVEDKKKQPEVNIPSEHKYTDWTKKIQVDDAIARKADQFAERMKKKKDDANIEGVLRIREKIKNPQNLKDYIIFAEILGKPKAHRR